MHAEAIVRRAAGLGITLSVVGNRIRYEPRSATPEDLVEALRSHKPEVIDYLDQRSASITPDEALLTWAHELAEHEVVLTEPLVYVETPLRTVTTDRISWYASHYLRTIATARLNQATGGWKTWTGCWWVEREQEAFGALKALRAAFDKEYSPETAIS